MESIQTDIILTLIGIIIGLVLGVASSRPNIYR